MGDKLFLAFKVRPEDPKILAAVLTTAQFEQWSRYAVRLRDKAESDEMGLDDYLREIRV